MTGEARALTGEARALTGEASTVTGADPAAIARAGGRHRIAGSPRSVRARGGRPADDGGATVWVLAVGLVTVLVALAFVGVGAAIVARHRAQGAADLGALAGAAEAIEGPGPACDRAAEIVAANGAELVGCQLDGLDLIVTTQARPGGLAGAVGTAHASARAGPVEPDG